MENTTLEQLAVLILAQMTSKPQTWKTFQHQFEGPWRLQLEKAFVDLNHDHKTYGLHIVLLYNSLITKN